MIANLHPQAERARFVRGTLDTLGMHDVPVGIGTNGGSRQNGEKRFFEAARQYMPDEGSARASAIVTGLTLLQTAFARATKSSMNPILLSSLTVSTNFAQRQRYMLKELL